MLMYDAFFTWKYNIMKKLNKDQKFKRVQLND